MRASCLAFYISRRRRASLEADGFPPCGIASKRPATASGCGGAGPSAASPLLPDAQRHRLRRGSLQPTPWRSQRRSTPFFSTLLVSDLEDVRAYYRKILPFYEKESAARARLVFWRSLARRRRPRRILEIGSGLGRITGVLSHQAPTIGLDISFDMLGRASRRVRGRSRARFVAADVRDAVFGPQFDLIVAPSD